MANNYYKTKKHKGYDSKFEYSKSQELDILKRAKKIQGYDVQIPIDLVHNGYKICTYIMDFVIHHNDGSVELLETKGVSTPTWSIKYKLLKAMYMDNKNVKVTVEFQGKGREPKPAKIKKGYNCPYLTT